MFHDSRRGQPTHALKGLGRGEASKRSSIPRIQPPDFADQARSIRGMHSSEKLVLSRCSKINQHSRVVAAEVIQLTGGWLDRSKMRIWSDRKKGTEL